MPVEEVPQGIGGAQLGAFVESLGQQSQQAEQAAQQGVETFQVPGAAAGSIFGSPGAAPFANKIDVVGDPAAINDFSAALKQLDTGEESELKPEAARTRRQEATVQQIVPGYPNLDFNAAWLEPAKYSEAQMVKLQRKLAAAGYLQTSSRGEFDVDTPGFYDEKTRSAVAKLLMDSQLFGYNPKALLSYRVRLAAGRHPAPLKSLSPETTPEEQQTALSEAYIEAWGGRQKPPPGYLQQFQHFNPEELKAYERSKATFQESDFSQDQQQQLLGMVTKFFGGGK